MASGGGSPGVKNWEEFDLMESDFLSEDSSYYGDAHLGNLDNELDVAKHYKTLYSMALGNCRKRKYQQSSKFVQTEPDTSGVPPSWIIDGQSMVNELYTGLGNIINTLYHSPNINEANTRQTDTKEFNPNKINMKYFKYESGYYVSKLMPNIRVPADVKVDDNREILSSAHLKKKLKELLRVATNLRNSVPYIYEDLNTLKYEGGDSEMQPKIMLSKSQQTEDNSKLCVCKLFSNLNASNRSNYFGLSEAEYLESGDNTKTRNGERVRKRNENTKRQQMADTICPPIEEDNGVTVTKCKIHRHMVCSGRDVENTAKKIPSVNVLAAKDTSKDTIFSMNDGGLIIVREQIANLDSNCECDLTEETCSSSNTNRSNIQRLNQMKSTGARAKLYKSPSNELMLNSKESKMNLILGRGPPREKSEASTSEAGSKNFILRNIKAAKNGRASCRASSNIQRLKQNFEGKGETAKENV